MSYYKELNKNNNNILNNLQQQLLKLSEFKNEIDKKDMIFCEKMNYIEKEMKSIKDEFKKMK